MVNNLPVVLVLVPQRGSCVPMGLVVAMGPFLVSSAVVCISLVVVLEW